MAVFTIGSKTLSGSPTGGAVGGASNLTTVGAIPYVSASGVLNQDATKLFWDTSGSYLYAGGYTNSSTYSVRLGPSGAEIALRNGATQIVNSGTVATFNTTQAAGYVFNDTGFNAAVSIKGNTGNTQFGGSTDRNAKLGVYSSGSTATAEFYDLTAVTGVTKVIVRAGAGQSITNLFEIQNNAGSIISRATSGGALYGSIVANVDNSGALSSGVEIASNGLIRFSSDTTFYGTKDTGLARNAAGILEVDSGTAVQYRDLILRRSQHSGVAVSALPAAAAGNAGSIQYVTDANATTIGSTVAGGGANKVMVWSDGTAWKIFAN